MNSSSTRQLWGWAWRIYRRTTFMILPAFLLMSCTVGPNYKRQNVPSPPTFRGSPDLAQQTSLADLPWWQIFHDETLTGLIKESLNNNNDLMVAVARVEQANEVAVQARS